MPLATPRRLDPTMLRPWVLLLLGRRPRHGYGLVAELRERGLPDPDRKSLWRLLRQLQEEHLVESDWQAGAAGPDRRVYRLTPAGDRRLDEDALAVEALTDDLRRFLEEYAESRGHG